jgi:hypothetical protein
VENGRPGVASVQGVINPTRFVCTFWSSHLGIVSKVNSPEKSPDTFSPSGFVENGRPGVASVQGVINPTRFVCTSWSSHLVI